MRDNCVDGRRNTVNHNVDQQAGLCNGLSAEDPRAAYCTNGVVKCQIAVAALSYHPLFFLEARTRCPPACAARYRCAVGGQDVRAPSPYFASSQFTIQGMPN